MSPGDVTVDPDVAPQAAPAQDSPPGRAPDHGHPPDHGQLAPGRAVAGAAVAVAGVCLGIGALLLVSGQPLTARVAADQAAPDPIARDQVAGALPPSETEVAPVDPPSPAPDPSRASAPGPAPSASAPAASAPSASAPSPRPATPPARADVVPVTVLNNSNRTGLADRAARRFTRGGWPVRLTGNFRGQIPVTTVYYDPGLEAAARAFARDFDGIARVRPRFAALPARGVVVVLTREFPA